MHATRQTYQAINLALFDFDGTLCRSDSFTGFIFYTLSKRHIMRQGLKILPWIQAYYFKLYPAHQMRPKLFSAMFKDSNAKNIHSMAEQYAHLLVHQLNPELLRRLRQHQAQGDDVVIVSASIDLYLEPFCRLLGVDLICTKTEVHQGKLSGFYSSPDCSCEQKKLRIQEKYTLTDYQSVYAYGNSYEDLEMFSLADYCYMVGEDAELPALEPIKKLA